MSATVSLNAEYLDEHLRFAVPLRMAKLLRAHNINGIPVRTIAELSHGQIVREYGLVVHRTAPWGDSDESPGEDLYSLIAVLGDSLFGQSRPGKAAAICAALTTALAAAAITHPDGVTWRDQHWCYQPHPNCPRKKEA
ncbi:MAG: hypothetical protein QM804_10220 [Propionicimonas sp.]